MTSKLGLSHADGAELKFFFSLFPLIVRIAENSKKEEAKIENKPGIQRSEGNFRPKTEN
jgi:hypothetical protein